MTIEMLKDRISKAEERIAKKKVTIEKKRNWIEKKRLTIESGKLTPNEVSWATSDIEMYEDDIQRLEKEIAETEKLVANYHEQLAGTVDRDKIFLTEVPEDFRKIQDELVAKWDAWDMKRREFLKEKYAELGYREFNRQFSFQDYELRCKSDKAIHEDNVKDSKGYVIGLYFRIRDITGKVTDWSELYFNGVAINGIIIGEAGRAKVETIEAGGYNIQRLHLRTLVHSI